MCDRVSRTARSGYLPFPRTYQKDGSDYLSCSLNGTSFLAPWIAEGVVKAGPTPSLERRRLATTTLATSSHHHHPPCTCTRPRPPVPLDELVRSSMPFSVPVECHIVFQVTWPGYIVQSCSSCVPVECLIVFLLHGRVTFHIKGPSG